jgi:putative spermidine/putrescine transport system permease protein
MANLQNTDPSLEEAAIMLGEHPVKAFFKITFPQVRMGVAGGALLSFIVSWNNYPLSIFLSTPEFAPLPVEIFFYLQWQFEPLIAAVSTITILFSILLIFAVERMIGLSAFTK